MFSSSNGRLNFVPFPPHERDLDCLQTRSRHPRTVMPNLALLCDWAIWNDGTVHGDRRTPPKTVFVRSDAKTLRTFSTSILPLLERSFVLITGSHDLPMPLGWEQQHGIDWRAILKHPDLVGWFSENLDLRHPRMHPVSLGIPNPDLASWIRDADHSAAVWTNDLFTRASEWRFRKRAQTVFGCWWDRGGHSSGTCPTGLDERTDARQTFADASFFRWVDPGLSRIDFLDQLCRDRFVLCPHGGGLDPSPRCWEALLVGTIPIVRRNTMTQALAHLPVAIVDEWSQVTEEQLERWSVKLGPRLLEPNLDYHLSNRCVFDQIDRLLHVAGEAGPSRRPHSQP